MNTAVVGSELLIASEKERGPATELCVANPEFETLIEPRSSDSASNQIVETGTTQASSDIVPIVLVQINANGEQIFVPALYIPARSESIDSSQLSQAEQRAVREVLGLETISKTQQPI